MFFFSWLLRSQLKLLIIIPTIGQLVVHAGYVDDFYIWNSSDPNGVQRQNESYSGIRLCSENYFLGNCVTIVDPIAKSCINLGTFNDSEINEKNVQSLELNGNCAYVYDNFGCEGKFRILSQGLGVHCQLALSTCRHQNRVRSIRNCKAKVAHKYPKANGSRGIPCKSECATRNSSFFWCYLHDDSKDYCFPRPGQHFFAGVKCHKNICTKPEHWDSKHVVLYSEREFQGKALEVLINGGDINCITTSKIAMEIRSISINHNCVMLYNEIGCNGAAIQMNVISTSWEIFQDLRILGNSKFASLSYCNASFASPYLRPKGYEGQLCLDTCQTYGKPYFRCIVNGTKWDYCSPRPRQDYLGNFCNTSCVTPVYNDQTWLPVVYEFSKFTGRNITLQRAKEPSYCYNLRNWNFSSKSRDDLITSIDLKSSCLEFFDDIGCNGLPLSIQDKYLLLHAVKLQPWKLYEMEGLLPQWKSKHFDGAQFGRKEFETKFVRRHSTVTNILAHFADSHFVTLHRTDGFIDIENRKLDELKSLSYCSVDRPKINRPGMGSRGQRCRTQCATHGRLYFWCNYSDLNSWDFCVPHEKMDYFGNYCENNCNHQDRPYKITLYELPGFHGKQHDIEYQEDRICYNLVERSNLSQITPIFRNGVASVNLFGNCAQLYKNIGCTDNFTELVPSVHDACQEDTTKCSKDNNWVSIRFCTTKFPPLFEASVTTNGSVCSDSCKPQKNGIFACTAVAGNMENCYPRNFVDSTGQFLRKSSTSVRKKYLKLYSNQDFKGFESIFYVYNTSQCYKATFKSMKMVNIPCVHLFNSSGCEDGVSIYINKEDGLRRSFLPRFASFVPSYFKICSAIGSTGISRRTCSTICHKNKEHPHYFSCKVTADLEDFCIPSSNRNHLGQTLNTDKGQFNRHNPRVLLVSQDTNMGIELNKTFNCYTLVNDQTDKSISIVSIESEQTCVHLFDDIGCTGNFSTAFVYRRCKNMRSPCTLQRHFRSISVCDFQLPTLYHSPISSTGGLCQVKCETRGKNYFWCHLNNGSMDTCLPIPGINFYGNHCKQCPTPLSLPTTDSCCPNKFKIKSEFSNTLPNASIIVYDGNYLTGKNLTVNTMEQMCISFNPISSHAHFDDRAKSIVLNGNCIYIYDEVGCDGKFRILRPHLDEQCQLSLSFCNWSRTISSLRHCNVTFPERFSPSFGSQGLPCSNECKVHYRRNYFVCNLEDGSKDYCNPRPMQHFIITNGSYNSNYTNPDFWNTPNVVVYSMSYFRGNALEIILNNTNNCVNLVHSDFDKSIGSINVKKNCVLLYFEIGCAGEGANPRSFGPNCLRDAQRCWYNEKLNSISSISFCNATFERSYFSLGLRGQLCVDECRPRGRPYFWCQLMHGLWDFCSPRMGQDYFGNNCNGPCTMPVPHGENFHVENNLLRPVLYENSFYRGRKFVLEINSSTQCFNLRFWNNGNQSFDKLTSSIVDNGHCINVFPDIGCTGEFFNRGAKSSLHTVRDLFDFNKIAVYHDTLDCLEDLAYEKCTMFGDVENINDAIMSVKLCNTSLPNLWNAIGSRGAPCDTQCKTQGKNYFWCQLNLQNAWDFCSPRRGTDYFGDDCTDDCNHSYRPYKVTLYDHTNFEGRSNDIQFEELRICHNLGQFELKNGIGSIELHGNCVQVYSNLGCTGVFTELIPTVDEKCSKDIRNCMRHTNVSSIRSCTTELPPLCRISFGTSGLRCQTACQPRGNSFACSVNIGHSEEECFPRDGISSTGEFKCPACKCYRDGYIVLHGGTNFTGESTVLQIKNKCINLDFEPFYDVNLHSNIRSVNLNGNDCIHLYAGIGCIGSYITINNANPCVSNVEDCGNWGLCSCNETWLSYNCSCREPHFSLRQCDGTDDYEDNKFGKNDTEIFLRSVSGIPCVSSCAAPGYYFVCNISEHMQDFCRPTTLQNHLGQPCIHGNCIYEKPRHNAVIFHGKYGEAPEILFNTTDNTRCYNILNTSRSQTKFFSFGDIFVENNTTCLILYTGIGCTGEYRKLSNEPENICSESIKCTTTFKSLRFCEAYLPSAFLLPFGSTGKQCRDKCETRGDSFFWCHLDDGSHDLCSPRPGLDFFGGNCENCTGLDSTAMKGLCSNVKSNQTSAFCNSGTRWTNVVVTYPINLIVIAKLLRSTIFNI